MSRFFSWSAEESNPIRLLGDFYDLLVLIVEIAAARAVFARAGYFNRAEGTILSVVVVFAIANVAFDAVVFIPHIKDLLFKSFSIMNVKEGFYTAKA